MHGKYKSIWIKLIQMQVTLTTIILILLLIPSIIKIKFYQVLQRQQIEKLEQFFNFLQV